MRKAAWWAVTFEWHDEERADEIDGRVQRQPREVRSPEWLVVELGGGYEFVWSSLARTAALGLRSPSDMPDPFQPSDASDRRAGRALLALADRYSEDTWTIEGRRTLDQNYADLRIADGLG